LKGKRFREAGKLIVLGGHVLPILVTSLFAGLLVAVASASYYLIEQPGQRLFGRFARWGNSGSFARLVGVME
jgi:peptidoglycan/LPS O-acetylase OafA/YrhL